MGVGERERERETSGDCSVILGTFGGTLRKVYFGRHQSFDYLHASSHTEASGRHSQLIILSIFGGSARIIYYVPYLISCLITPIIAGQRRARSRSQIKCRATACRLFAFWERTALLLRSLLMRGMRGSVEGVQTKVFLYARPTRPQL